MFELDEIMDRMKEEGCPVIVEGRRDKEALEKWGIENVLTLKGRRIIDVAECIHYKKAIILTDLDKRGKYLAHLLSLYLKSNGVYPDFTYRKLLGLYVRKIEELRKWGDIYGEDIHRCGKVYDLRSYRNRRYCGKTRRYRSHIRSNRRAIGR